MKYWSVFFFIFILMGVSCKKEISEFEVYKEPKSVRIDTNALFLKNKTLRDFYRNNEYYTVWVAEKNREDLIEAIQSFEEDALQPEKFSLSKLIDYNLKYSSLKYPQKIQADLLFSEIFLKAVQQLAHGRINPKKFYGDWEPDLKKIDLNLVLLQAVSEEDVAGMLESVKPKNRYYVGLKQALHEYRDLGKDTLLPVSTQQISKIKKRLHFFGDYPSEDFSNIWDESSKEALVKFQKRHALHATGTVNTETINALNVSKNQRIKQIIANMERARWIPDHLGENYVLVNLPEFKLFVYEKERLTESHAVIIGKDSRKTPILSSQFSNLVINPTWTVPPTILKNDLVPRASADRGYFARNRMTIYSKNGQVVDPKDWDPSSARSYRYVQTTGGNNSLGLIKFDFPNDHMVYLHDTNNRSMFGNKNRALSSGCVRVQNPFDLASRILEMEGSAYNRVKLDTMVAKNKTQYIKLKKEVNVYQLYWTAWKDDQGVQFRDDVYQYDNGLYAKIMN